MYVRCANEGKALPHTCSPLSITQTLSDQNLGLLKATNRPQLTIKTSMSIDSGDDFEEVFPMSLSRDEVEELEFISPLSSTRSSLCSSLQVSEDSLDDMMFESNHFRIIPTYCAVQAATVVPASVKARGAFNCSPSNTANRQQLINQWAKRDIDGEGDRRFRSPQEIMKRRYAINAIKGL